MPSQKRFHAVEIRCAMDACRAAQDRRGQRYLATEAPALPLEQCDRAGDCECRFRHYDDRRQGPRRSDEGAEGAGPVRRQRTEQRKLRGRRASDEIEASGASLDDTYYEYLTIGRKQAR